MVAATDSIHWKIIDLMKLMRHGLIVPRPSLQGHALRFSVIHSFKKGNESLHLGPWPDLSCLFSHHNVPTALDWEWHFIQVCSLTTSHSCSPLVIQLRTLAAATDIADRSLIILSLSNCSIVCFKSFRIVVVGRTEEWHFSSKPDGGEINSVLGCFCLSSCCWHFSSITACFLQVIHEMASNWHTIVVCRVDF